MADCLALWRPGATECSSRESAGKLLCCVRCWRRREVPSRNAGHRIDAVVAEVRTPRAAEVAEHAGGEVGGCEVAVQLDEPSVRRAQPRGARADATADELAPLGVPECGDRLQRGA